MNNWDAIKDRFTKLGDKYLEQAELFKKVFDDATRFTRESKRISSLNIEEMQSDRFKFNFIGKTFLVLHTFGINNLAEIRLYNYDVVGELSEQPICILYIDTLSNVYNNNNYSNALCNLKTWTQDMTTIFLKLLEECEKHSLPQTAISE